jgi:hypothetical protein
MVTHVRPRQKERNWYLLKTNNFLKIWFANILVNDLQFVSQYVNNNNNNNVRIYMAPFHYMLKAPSVSNLDVIENTAVYLTV